MHIARSPKGTGDKWVATESGIEDSTRVRPMNHKLDTIRPSITLSSGNDARVVTRAVRMYDGKLCISARKSLFAITVTGAGTATCDLDAPALIAGVADAQAIAPVCTNAVLGIVRKAKSPAVAPVAQATPAPDMSVLAAAVVAYLKQNP